MNLVVATLLCERKPWDYWAIAENRRSLFQVDRFYFNFEQGALVVPNNKVISGDIGKSVHADVWAVVSDWREPITYDQDQKRLLGIVTARNMAIDYALSTGATHLLFIDSDVFPDPIGLGHLLDTQFRLNVDLCGGLVPGRGSHSHVNYVFGGKRGIVDKGWMYECDHGTCGYMLITRKAFGQLRFRWGDDWEIPGQFLSEDPAYCDDWYRISGQRFIIDKRATAIHSGDLNPEEVAQDSWKTVQLKENSNDTNA